MGSLRICCEFLDFKWVWHSLCDGYKVEENGLTLKNICAGDSSWSRWAYTQPFPTEGKHTLSIKINRKRLDQGWLGIGVIRKSFVEKTKTKEGGFKIYSNHAIFVDPSWNAIESHFNLLSLDISKQSQIKEKDIVRMTVNNDKRSIEFFVNSDTVPFARGNWEFLDYEPLCGYAILTSRNDEVS